MSEQVAACAGSLAAAAAGFGVIGLIVEVHFNSRRRLAVDFANDDGEQFGFHMRVVFCGLGILGQ